MNTAAAVADFRTYPLISALHGVQNLVDRVLIEWADRRISPFHHVWLRDNCPCAQCVYSVTREQLFEIADAAPDLAPNAAYIDTDGCLRIDWQDGHLSRFDAGWLRAHAYDEQSRRERLAGKPRAHLWHSDLRLPVFDYAALMDDDQALLHWLLAVFMLNGIASAIPATLVLFFIQDRLQAPPAQEPMFLAAYFVCAALSIPLWLRAVARWGLARTWLAGMLLAIAVFVWTAFLGAGDVVPFLVVCALSGVALGTDLALPSALLAGVIAAEGDSGQHEGAYFGWWNFATKLNLALAAGLALPLLGWLGYSPGTRSDDGLQTLGLAYAVLPCVLKFTAAAALYLLILRRPRGAAIV